MLILLSDIDGLYTADPHTHPEAKLLHHVAGIDDHIREIAGISSSSQGTGGMVTKLHAADICLGCGCKMVIANGNLYDILEGKTVGTTFSEERL
jgi:glutamate 5-kinase